MALKIKPKNRYSTGLPDPSVLDAGELWINTADKTIGVKDNQDQIVILADLTKSVADSTYLSITAAGSTYATQEAVTALTQTVNAKANDADVVKLAGNQTIAGTKTFSSTIVGNISGTAAALATAQTISISGDATGSTTFNGSVAADIAITLSATGVTAQAYGQETEGQLAFGQQITIPKVTVDAKGRITNAKNVVVTLPAAPTSVESANTLTTARTIDGIAFNGSANINHYAAVSEEADAITKTATITGFTLAVGATAILTLTNGNSASSPMLNISRTGTKAIISSGQVLGSITAGTTLMVVYDGTNYQVVGGASSIDYSKYYTKEQMDAKFLPIMKPSAKGTVSIYGQTEPEAQPVVEAYNAAKASAAQNTGPLNCYTKEEADALFVTIVNPVIIDTLTIQDEEVA